jgi:hypothetical protein
VECTLNCGNSIPLDRLPEHIWLVLIAVVVIVGVVVVVVIVIVVLMSYLALLCSFCPMRMMPCEPGKDHDCSDFYDHSNNIIIR